MLVHPVAPVLRFVGDLVGANGAGVWTALAAMRGERLIMVDLTDTGFIDGPGLRSLGAGIRAIQDDGTTVLVVCPAGAARRALATGGLRALAPVVASVQEANEHASRTVSASLLATA